jgi:ABC-type phosphate/phosphonate transport system permease subunit
MNTHAIPSPDTSDDALDPTIRQQLRNAAFRRNLRTATVLGLAASGGLVSTLWLAITAGGTFLALTTWRYKQLRQYDHL